MILERYLSRFDTDIEALVLGCTHYPILRERIDHFFGGRLPIIDSGAEAARKFIQYLKNHPEIQNVLDTNANRQYFTTGDNLHFDELGSILMAEDIHSSKITLS